MNYVHLTKSYINDEKYHNYILFKGKMNASIEALESDLELYFH